MHLDDPDSKQMMALQSIEMLLLVRFKALLMKRN